jgi:hypothetical protein
MEEFTMAATIAGAEVYQVAHREGFKAGLAFGVAVLIVAKGASTYRKLRNEKNLQEDRNWYTNRTR